MLIFSFFNLSANNIDEAWEALENQDRELARKLFTKALKQEQTRLDAAMALTFLNTVEVNLESFELMQEVYPDMADPSPYLYALWLDEAVNKDSYVKEKKRVDFLKKIISDKRVNRSVSGSAHYTLGMHYLLANRREDAWANWEQIKAITDWQYTGPFDNPSGSGYNKNYPPVQLAAPDAVFQSKGSYDIQWFTPKYKQKEGWAASQFCIQSSESVVYLQTFVTSPGERTVTVSLGGTGQLKLWANDVLAIEQPEERRTDMDLMQRRVKLKKGVNRILVQLGFTDNTNYPNILVRLLDENGQPVEGLTCSSKYQPYAKGSTADLGELIPHFAEAFFKKKIEDEPRNLINYLLLAKTYYRSKNTEQAILTLKKALATAPNNILLHHALLENFSDLDNRTELIRQLEKLRKLDPGLPLILAYDLEISFSNEDYEKADELFGQLRPYIGDSSEGYFDYLIRIQTARKEYAALLTTVKEAFKKHPNNKQYLLYNYRLLKKTDPDAKAPAALLEKYLKENYSHSVVRQLASEYIKLGNRGKAEKLLLRELDMAPYDYILTSQMAKFYYEQEDYERALEMAEMRLANMPYNAAALKDKAYILEAMGREEETIAAFEKAVLYGKNLFKERKKLRQLQGKKPILSYFKKDKVYDEINAFLSRPIATDDNYEYIFYEENMAIFEGGASLDYETLAIRVLTESGVNQWKETSIGYNSNQQLFIEKAEVIKQNGERILAETNDNQIVFPSLEIGDAILVTYRLESYAFGKLGQKHWFTWGGNAFVPMGRSIFRLLVPTDLEIDILENPLLPSKHIAKKTEEFTLHEWTLTEPEKCSDEPWMPAFSEIGICVDYSTVPSWEYLSDWYHDLGLSVSKEDFLLDEAYDRIFAGKNLQTDQEKAIAIYDYLCENVRYSSVDFRQSNYVPQKPSLTLSTQLGDCKDLSLLYHTLAKKAGLNTHLVLVNLRNNGEETMRLPSMEFDHCIISIDLDGKQLFQELTSEKLPFGAMPNHLINAQALVIPNYEGEAIGQQLMHLPRKAEVPTEIHRKTTVAINGKNLEINTQLEAKGDRAGSHRYYFLGLTKEQTKEKMEGLLNRPFNNHLELEDFQFQNLDSRDPVFTYTADFTAQNELISLGNLKAVKVPYFDLLFDLDDFPNKERKCPLLYWVYENTEAYSTEIVLDLPDGSTLVELPEAVDIDNEFIKYQLVIEKVTDQKVKVTRTVATQRTNIPAERYLDFRETIKQIVEAEDKYVVFK